MPAAFLITQTCTHRLLVLPGAVWWPEGGRGQLGFKTSMGSLPLPTLTQLKRVISALGKKTGEALEARL